MPNPRPGDFFTTPTTGKWYHKIFAWLIRWFTARKVPAKRSWRTLWRSYRWDYPKVNHAGLFIGPTDEFPEGAVIEAVGRVRISSVNDYPEAFWSKIELEDEWRTDIVNFAHYQVGKFYNWLGLVAVGLAQERFGRHLKDLSHDWWVKKLSDGKKWFCSQLVDAAFNWSHVQLFVDGRPTGLVSPRDLYDLPGGH